MRPIDANLVKNFNLVFNMKVNICPFRIFSLVLIINVSLTKILDDVISKLSMLPMQHHFVVNSFYVLTTLK